MELRGLGFWVETCKPYVLNSLNELFLAVFMILLQSVLSKGVVNSLAIVVYEHIVATVLVSVLAFFLERERRPPLSVKILCYAFVLGLLQITLGQLLLSMSLQFIASSYQSIGLNFITPLVLVLAVVFGQEKLRFWSTNGQAKIWGVTLSAAGVFITILWAGPTLLKSTNFGSFQVASEGTLGAIMIIVGVLGTSFWSILVGPVTQIYPVLSLTAMMTFFGTIQTAIVAAIVIPSSSWELQWLGGLVLLTILFGGIVVTGFSYYVMTWSVNKMGPVFTSAFSPLLIVFSFLMDTFILGDSAHWGSIVGAFLVVVGLYIILWAKAEDKKNNDQIRDEVSINSPLIQP